MRGASEKEERLSALTPHVGAGRHTSGAHEVGWYCYRFPDSSLYSRTAFSIRLRIRSASCRAVARRLHALAIGFHVGAVHPPVHRAVAGQRPQRGAAVGGGIVAARKQGCGLRRKGQKEQGQYQQSTHIVSFPGGIPGYTGSFYQKRPEEYRNPSQEGAVGRSGRGASRAYPPQTAQRHNTMLRAMFSAAKDASPER